MTNVGRFFRHQVQFNYIPQVREFHLFSIPLPIVIGNGDWREGVLIASQIYTPGFK